MARTHRRSTIAILVACLVGTPLGGTLLASEQAPSSKPSSSGEQPASATDLLSGLPSTVKHPLFVVSDEALTGESFLAQRGWRRGRGRGGRNGAAQAEVLLGVIASVTGAAILVYSHRPECGASPSPVGCGYGTRVVGGAVLSGGILSLVIGALTWR